MIILWGKDDVEKVRKLAAQGMTAQRMADILGRTRGSISGICHRNKIDICGKRVALPKIITDKISIKDTMNILEAKSDNCRWIEGDAKLMKCCGRQAANGCYCQEHRERVYVPIRKRPL